MRDARRLCQEETVSVLKPQLALFLVRQVLRHLERPLRPFGGRVPLAGPLAKGFFLFVFFFEVRDHMRDLPLSYPLASSYT